MVGQDGPLRFVNEAEHLLHELHLAQGSVPRPQVGSNDDIAGIGLPAQVRQRDVAVAHVAVVAPETAHIVPVHRHRLQIARCSLPVAIDVHRGVVGNGGSAEVAHQGHYLGVGAVGHAPHLEVDKPCVLPVIGQLRRSQHIVQVAVLAHRQYALRLGPHHEHVLHAIAVHIAQCHTHRRIVACRSAETAVCHPGLCCPAVQQHGSIVDIHVAVHVDEDIVHAILVEVSRQYLEIPLHVVDARLRCAVLVIVEEILEGAFGQTGIIVCVGQSDLSELPVVLR